MALSLLPLSGSVFFSSFWLLFSSVPVFYFVIQLSSVCSSFASYVFPPLSPCTPVLCFTSSAFFAFLSPHLLLWSVLLYLSVVFFSVSSPILVFLSWCFVLLPICVYWTWHCKYLPVWAPQFGSTCFPHPDENTALKLSLTNYTVKFCNL